MVVKVALMPMTVSHAEGVAHRKCPESCDDLVQVISAQWGTVPDGAEHGL